MKTFWQFLFLTPLYIFLGLALTTELALADRGSDSGRDSGRSGGWGSSGGGSGVACYRDTTKKEMQSLVTLEYWEWDENKPFELFKPKSSDFKGILKEVDARISLEAPLFIYRLRQASQIIEMSDWSKKTNIPKINDVKPTRKIPNNCELVQLAARYHRDPEIKIGTGPMTKIPEVVIDFNIELFEKLDPLNQAILVLHEQMYLLGKTIGHRTSDEIRFLVMRFFEKDLENRAKVKNLNFDLRFVLSAYLGDYVLYFSDIGLPSSPLTQESRFNAFIEMLVKFRKDVELCDKKGGDVKRCSDLAMQDIEGHLKWFTEEMTFIFYVHYVLDLMYGFVNAEIILAPLKDEFFVKYSQDYLKNMCESTRIAQSKLLGKILVEKTLSYCSKLGF